MSGRARFRPGLRRRITRVAILSVAIALAWFVGRPCGHVLLAWLGDVDQRQPPPAGHVDDASRLNLTPVREIITVERERAAAEAQLAAVLARARGHGLPVSIAGARHTMGGHVIAPDGVVIDMRDFDAFALDETARVLHVQAGARWSQIIPWLDERGMSIEIMQSNNSFTVGGSISANCHGWQPNRPPIASSVLAMRMMLADGSIVRCSRVEHAELFSLALGGYGLFGVILDVELRIVPNERYRLRRSVLGSNDLAEAFRRAIEDDAAVGMAFARLRVTSEGFLSEAALNVFERAPCLPHEIPALHEPTATALKRAVFRGSAGSEYGKQVRWQAETLLSDRLDDDFASRNQLLNDPVELYQNRTSSSTDILHEYFVPPDQFNGFIDRMREIIPRHGGDLLNVTVRHVLEDRDTFLRYADREMLALVLLFNQQRDEAGEAQVRQMARELIDAALSCGGRHYLPYRLHATPEQFHAAYPQGDEFFALKRKYDPDGVFVNGFSLAYGAPK